MTNLTPALFEALTSVISAVRLRTLSGKTPILVAIDGGSGSGKSTLAALLSQILGATLIQSDDFYAAHIPGAEWAKRSPAEKARDCVDWQRLRAEAIAPLLARKPARWHPFDFENLRPDGTYPLHADYVERQPAEVIILDGAYSSRPELADVIDLSVLVDVPVNIRHQRLSGREPAEFLESWHARWDASEAYYFTYVRPPASFDLIINL